MHRIQGYYFQPFSSAKSEAELNVDEEGSLTIEALGVDSSIDQVDISTRLADTNRIIRFPDGSSFHTEENDAVDLAIKEHKRSNFIEHRLESKLKYIIASTVMMVGLVYFAIVHGGEMLSNVLTPMLPEDALTELSQETFDLLDKNILFESRLDKKSQQIIRKGFNHLTAHEPKYKLHFRTSHFMGPNAFALPSGDIVITDELIELSQDPQFRGIIGVLAHEKGHVELKHSLRSIIKTTVSGIIVAFFMGDFSDIATGLSTFVINNQYSQEHEREADAYAKTELKRVGISPTYLASLFKALDQKVSNGEEETNSLFSTHPLTKERIEYFKQE
jgi:Zn-dependent protease with chaperone function